MTRRSASGRSKKTRSIRRAGDTRSEESVPPRSGKDLVDVMQAHRYGTSTLAGPLPPSRAGRGTVTLLHVLHLLRRAAKRLLRQRRLHERIEIAVEHASGIG